MTTLWIPNNARSVIQARKFVQNGKQPDAELMAELALQANFGGRWLTQEIARFGQNVGSIPSNGATYGWRAQWHSSPFAYRVMVQFLCALEDGPAADPYVQLVVKNTSGTTIGQCAFHFGYNNGKPPDVPSEWATATLTLQQTSVNLPASIPTDTDLRLEIIQSNSRCISCCVYELSRPPTTANGYASQDFGAFSPILSTDRANVATVAVGVWKHGAAKLWNHGNNSLASYASTTARNVVDRTSTTVSTSTPGATLDLTERSTKRLSSSGVPVTMAVYGQATTSNGSVTLKNSSGTALLTVSVGTTAGWYTTTGYLPATVAKYDLHEAAGASGTLTTHAVSLYQYLS